MTALEMCGELDRQKREGVPFDRLLSAAVEMLHESSPRFDWTGIYELCPDDMLRLGPFRGSPTSHVFIAVGRGVCGSAVAERRNMNVADVSEAPDYLACSEETKSELVVLIRKGERIFAQIDIDSHERGAFSERIVRDVELVADWLADVYDLRERLRPSSMG